MFSGISKDLHENLKYIRTSLGSLSDLIIREFETEDVYRIRLATIYIEI